MTRDAEAPRVLFLRQGGFSHSNAQLLAAMRRVRPDVVFDDLDLTAAVRGSLRAATLCMIGAFRTHGAGLLRSRTSLREGFNRNAAYFSVVANLVRDRVARGNYICTLQTQSLFNGAVGSTPNYVYTDHAALARQKADWTDPDGHPGWAEKPDWLAMEGGIYSDAAHVFTFGSRVRQILIEGYGLSPDRVSWAGCGASSLPTDPPSRDLDRYARRRVLFVGIDWERKGGPDLLAAFERLRARLPDATLDVVGCNPAEAQGRAGVTCYGKIPLAEVEARYREASCFCMPTRREPFGVVFVEAAHYALPAVGTNVGDIGDVVRDGENGWRVPPGDPAALADALFRVLEVPETAQRMGAAGAAIAPDWTWDVVAARILARMPLAATAEAA